MPYEYTKREADREAERQRTAPWKKFKKSKEWQNYKNKYRRDPATSTNEKQ